VRHKAADLIAVIRRVIQPAVLPALSYPGVPVITRLPVIKTQLSDKYEENGGINPS
jgi:hypothetical protein